MKPSPIYSVLLCLGLSLLNLSAHAEGDVIQTPQASAVADQVDAGAPLPAHNILQVLLTMDKEQLSRLRETIARIETMPEAEKQQLQQQINKIRQMDEGKHREIRKRYEALSKETRAEMHQRWISMDNEERMQWREKLSNMSREERNKVFEAEGFFPHRPKHLKERPKQAFEPNPERKNPEIAIKERAKSSSSEEESDASN